MKKLISLFFSILMLAAALLLPADANSCELDKSKIFRLHIIANSNSEADQQVKLLVRDAVLRYEKELFEKNGAVDNASTAKKLLTENASDINSIAKDVLEKNGFYYPVKISTGIYDFPDRIYGDQLYPAGKYSALRLVLGDGKGENWWCVMFPPLCIIDDDAGKSEHKEAASSSDNTVEFRSIFSAIGKWFVELFD